jgi:hypothetical protein
MPKRIFSCLRVVSHTSSDLHSKQLNFFSTSFASQFLSSDSMSYPILNDVRRGGVGVEELAGLLQQLSRRS